MQNMPYKLTPLCLTLYYFVALGRIHSVLPMTRLIPMGLISGILTVLAFASEYSSRKQPLAFCREEKRALWLLGVSVAMIPFSQWPLYSLQMVYKRYLVIIIMMLITVLVIRTLEELRKFIWVFILTTLFTVLIGLKAGITHESKEFSDSYDPNDLAMIIVMTLPFMFYLLKSSGAFKRLLLTASIGLSLAALVLSASRTGMLGLVVVGLSTTMMSRKKTIPILLGAAFLTGVVFFAPASVTDRFATMINPQTEYDSSFGERTHTWKRGVKQFFTYAVQGAGIGNYSIADGQTRLEEGGKWRAAHNSYLQIGVELGAAGLILFVLFVGGAYRRVKVVRKALQRDAEEHDYLWIVKSIEASLAGYMVMAFFLSQAYSGHLYLVISFAVVVLKKFEYLLVPQTEPAEGALPAR